MYTKLSALLHLVKVIENKSDTFYQVLFILKSYTEWYLSDTYFSAEETSTRVYPIGCTHFLVIVTLARQRLINQPYICQRKSYSITICQVGQATPNNTIVGSQFQHPHSKELIFSMELSLFIVISIL